MMPTSQDPTSQDPASVPASDLPAGTSTPAVDVSSLQRPQKRPPPLITQDPSVTQVAIHTLNPTPATPQAQQHQPFHNAGQANTSQPVSRSSRLSQEHFQKFKDHLDKFKTIINTPTMEETDEEGIRRELKAMQDLKLPSKLNMFINKLSKERNCMEIVRGFDRLEAISKEFSSNPTGSSHYPIGMTPPLVQKSLAAPQYTKLQYKTILKSGGELLAPESEAPWVPRTPRAEGGDGGGQKINIQIANLKDVKESAQQKIEMILKNAGNNYNSLKKEDLLSIMDTLKVILNDVSGFIRQIDSPAIHLEFYDPHISSIRFAKSVCLNMMNVLNQLPSEIQENVKRLKEEIERAELKLLSDKKETVGGGKEGSQQEVDKEGSQQEAQQLSFVGEQAPVGAQSWDEPMAKAQQKIEIILKKAGNNFNFLKKDDLLSILYNLQEILRMSNRVLMDEDRELCEICLPYIGFAKSVCSHIVKALDKLSPEVQALCNKENLNKLEQEIEQAESQLKSMF